MINNKKIIGIKFCKQIACLKNDIILIEMNINSKYFRTWEHACYAAHFTFWHTKIRQFINKINVFTRYVGDLKGLYNQ